MIKIIAAVAKNNVIGKANDLPWHIPEDLQRFKKLTSKQTVLMGSKTFMSIFNRLGKSLPNRKNIVISRQSKEKFPQNVIVFDSLSQAINHLSDKDLWIIGGASIYQQTIDLADKLYITEINQTIDGDTFFPKIDKNVWQETLREKHNGFDFVEYERKNKWIK